jgi:hypothetical protein
MHPDEFVKYANSVLCEAKPCQPILGRVQGMLSLSGQCVERLGSIHFVLTGDGFPEQDRNPALPAPLSVEEIIRLLERDIECVLSRIADIQNRLGG